jgi:hypothetical protein
MRSKSEEYRRTAATCLTVAEQFNDPAAKALLIGMARAWYALADQAERNSKTDLVYETPTPQPEPQQPVVQQQQQIQPATDEPES